MRKLSKKATITIVVAVVALLLAAEILVVVLLYQGAQNRLQNEYTLKIAQMQETIPHDLYDQGFVNVEEAMLAAGYSRKNSADARMIFVAPEDAYEVAFDFETLKVSKDVFTFEVPAYTYQSYDEENYLLSEFISKIINMDIVANYPHIEVSAPPLQRLAWAEKSSFLIAESGGLVRENGNLYAGTNSVGALVQNYDLGHRVFELVFELTEEGDIQTVPGRELIEILSQNPSQEPADESLFVAPDLEEIVTMMRINKDMYIVPNAQIFEGPAEQAARFYETLIATVKQTDAQLLERIIPMVYSKEMYDAVQQLYAFPCVIYNVFNTAEGGDSVAKYVASKENIQVVLMAAEHFTEEFIAKLAEGGVMLFTDTIDIPDPIDASLSEEEQEAAAKILPLTETEVVVKVLRGGGMGFVTNSLSPASLGEIIQLYGILRPTWVDSIAK